MGSLSSASTFPRSLIRFSILPPSHHQQQRRSFVEGARIKWIRDRALDAVVEREKHLKPILSLLHFPPQSLHKSHLSLIHKFPSIFILPSAPASSLSLTPAALRLLSDERSLHCSCLPSTALRLVKLLSLTPSLSLPLSLLRRLPFDLSLPPDFPLSLLPSFPDSFSVDPHHPLSLSLLRPRPDLAFSALELSAASAGQLPRRGAPLAFPLRFPPGFYLTRKVKDWVDNWQRLPYISPYEDARHLAPGSDLAEKWVVGLLHEVLHLTVAKRAERDNLLALGEYMGLAKMFERAIKNHPGIFYVSNKLAMRTVVLREAYRKDLLVVKNPLMGIRYQYIRLMKQSEKIGQVAFNDYVQIGAEEGDDDGEGEWCHDNNFADESVRQPHGFESLGSLET